MSEQEFESADAGASATVPTTAGNLRKGHHVMIKGCPCKIVEISTSKTGKHGHAKAHIIALDIFTGKKMEDLCPTSHTTSQPNVTRTEYQLLNVDDDDVSLLDEAGAVKDDLRINQSDEKHAAIRKAFDEGKNLIITVLAACGTEKIIDFREVKEGV